MKQTYKQHQAQLKAEQSELSYDQIKSLMQDQNEALFELDRIEPKTHNWIDRGIVKSCEGAGHPAHKYYVRAR